MPQCDNEPLTHEIAQAKLDILRDIMREVLDLSEIIGIAKSHQKLDDAALYSKG